MKFICICAAVGALLGSAAAYTQAAHGDATAPPKRYLSKFDSQFNAADKDGDGALTREEAANAGMGRIVDNFDRIDTNHDGKVTRDEIRAMIRSRLSS